MMTLPAYNLNPSPRLAEYDNRFILHLEMKQGRPECALECNDYSVRRAATVLEYMGTASLVKQMYSRRGYLTEGITPLPRHDNTITLDAHDAQQIMATLTIRFDSHDTGLFADALYVKEIDQFRATGRKVCELTKLAVDPRYGSKELMASLFQLAYLYAHVIHGATDTCIEVNPRHVGFYKRMLGFQEIGEARTCPRVNAPAVLLHIECDYMRRQIARHSGKAHGYRSSEKSLYPYFLNCSAEDWIDRALRAKASRTH
jgi:ribosomal protein S18 acetylase RimI-like enzyme